MLRLISAAVIMRGHVTEQGLHSLTPVPTYFLQSSLTPEGYKTALDSL